MSIKVGDQIPTSTLSVMTDTGPEPVSTHELFSGKKVVLFSVPGAFTPTCSAKHLPGFVEHAEAILATRRRYDRLHGGERRIRNARLGQERRSRTHPDAGRRQRRIHRALGLELDATAFGMGHRSQRFALIAEDGRVTDLFVEGPGEFRVSSADHVLSKL